MDTDEKSQKEWISHFVGNGLAHARFEIAKGRSAEEVKVDLIARLKARTSGTLVDEVQGFLSEHEWKTKEGVEAFARDYDNFEKKYGMGL